MKRFLVFLLLLLVSFATLAPCCSFDDCPTEHATAQHDDQQDKGEGTCSPFSSCATCPPFVPTSKPLPVLQHPVPAPLRHVAREHTTPLQNVDRSFWQPPKNA